MNRSKNTGILIIGGGVIGLAIARELKKRGASRITVLERGAIGKESSYAAAGMLAPSAETEKKDDFFRLCDASNKLYADFAAALFEETGVDIELDRSGTFYLAFTEHDAAEIRRRFEWQKENLAVEFLSAADVRRAEPFISPDVLEGLFFPNDWQVENRKLLAALEKFCRASGVEIIENARIENLLAENGKIVGAETTGEKFFAERVVLATGAWTSFVKLDENALPAPKIKPIRGQIIAFQTAKRSFERVIYSPRGYIVPRRDGRILAGATVEDVGFDKSITTEGIESLREISLEIAPSLANLKLNDQWAGLRPFAADGLPVLGAFPDIENLYIATGHYRNGILLAPLTAKILADKIIGDSESKFLGAFSPRRFQIAGAR